MKKGRYILFGVCALCMALAVGVMIGRELREPFVPIPQSIDVHQSAEEAQLVVSTEPKDYRLDINTATKLQLMELPGIGEIIAERILDYREQNGGFSSTDELINIEGIGEKKLFEIQHLIRAGG